MNYLVLKGELTTDPETLGYAAMTDAQVTASLNAPTRTAPVTSVTGQQIFEAVVPADRLALSAEDKQLFYAFIGMQTLLINGTNTKAALAAMFSGPSATMTALIALQTTPTSRAAELRLGALKEGHVQRARLQLAAEAEEV